MAWRAGKLLNIIRDPSNSDARVSTDDAAAGNPRSPFIHASTAASIQRRGGNADVFAHTFSRLFQISWFPFLLTIACIVALAALVHAQPPLLPDWLYFREWDPPTWLKVVATAPFAAMVLSYVLREMSDRYADRGAFRIDRLGFELSRPVLAAALLLAAFDIWVGVLRLARRALGAAMIIGLYGSAFNEADVRLWIVLSGPIKAVLEAIAAMWCYLLAGLIVTAGRLNITDQVAHVWEIIRGNWIVCWCSVC